MNLRESVFRQDFQIVPGVVYHRTSQTVEHTDTLLTNLYKSGVLQYLKMAGGVGDSCPNFPGQSRHIPLTLGEDIEDFQPFRT